MYIGVYWVNLLLDKFNEYKSIVNFQVEYEFENGDIIKFKLKQTDFPHLIGLHKLIDIPLIRQFNDKSNLNVSAKFVIGRIKKERVLTDSIVRASTYFPDIEERYEKFGKDNLLTLSYTDAIIDFDASLIGSSLKADYILFEQKKEGGYNHLCVAEDASAKKYAESFFYCPTDLYLQRQTIVKVKRVRIYDNKGNLYLEDVLL